MVQGLGEGEKNARMGEGVAPIVGNGKSGEGEKMLEWVEWR